MNLFVFGSCVVISAVSVTNFVAQPTEPIEMKLGMENTWNMKVETRIRPK